MEITQHLCDIRATDLARRVLAVNNFEPYQKFGVAWNVPPRYHCQVKINTVALITNMAHKFRVFSSFYCKGGSHPRHLQVYLG